MGGLRVEHGMGSTALQVHYVETKSSQVCLLLPGWVLPSPWCLQGVDILECSWKLLCANKQI